MLCMPRVLLPLCVCAKRTVFSTTAIFIFLALVRISGFAQDAPSPLTMGWGIDPSIGYDNSDIDSVSHTDGTLILHIPFITIPQKGDLPPFSLVLRYNSTNWSFEQFTSSCASDPACPYHTWVYSGGGVELVRANYVIPSFSVVGKVPTQTAGAYNDLKASFVIDTLGGTHLYHSIAGQTYSETIDGSNYQITNPVNTLETKITDRNGISYTSGCPNQQCTAPVDITSDLYGNSISGVSNASGSTWTDSFGHTLLGPPLANEGLYRNVLGTSPGCQTFNYPSATGTSPYEICWSSLNISTDFEVPSSACSDCKEGSATIVAVTSITSPSGSYTFQYDSWGSLHVVTLPRGGAITYGWVTSVDTDHVTYYRRLQTRTVDDGAGHLASWSYQSDPTNGTFTITAPPVDGANGGNYVVYSSFQDANLRFISQEQHYAADGTLLKTIQSDGRENPLTTTDLYLGNPDGGLPGHPHVKTIWPDGTVSQTCSMYDNDTVDDCNNNASLPGNGVTVQYTDENQQLISPGSQTIYYTLSPSMLMKQDEFALGSGGNIGALARQTAYTYKWQTASGYQAANLWDIIASTITTDGSGNILSQTATSYDESNGSPQGYYGNPTTSKVWLNTTNQFLSTQSVYTNQGKVSKTIDPKGAQTSITFQCSSTYPYQVTNALSQVTTYGYDCNTGLVTSIQTPNDAAASRPGTTFSYDSANDLLSVSYPDGGQTSYSYNGYANPLILTTKIKKDASTNIQSSVKYDGLGRSVTSTNPSGATSETTYNAVGLVSSISNFHTSSTSQTDGYETFAYDGLQRKTLECNQDNGTGSAPCIVGSSYKKWSYTGNSVTETDENGNQHTATTDAWGRIIKALEPNGVSTSPTMETDYNYDSYGNLSVKQWGGTYGSANPVLRSFYYDNLSRPTQAYNPESGWTCYGTTGGTTTGIAPNGSNCTPDYDANGNLLHKTDARGITTAYSYDALNRLTSKTYLRGTTAEGTPTAVFNYDETAVTVGTGANFWKGPWSTFNGIGRLTSQYTGQSAPGVGLTVKSFAYDALGRLLNTSECWGSTSCSDTYGTRRAGWTYDLAGNITSKGFGTWAKHLFTYNSSGNLQTQIIQFQLIQNGSYVLVNIPIVSSATYYPNSNLKTLTTNTESGATIADTWGADNRERTTSFVSQSTSDPGYTNYGYGLTYFNNGNVQTVSETAYQPSVGQKNWSWATSYDTLNRLTTAVSSGDVAVGCQETYDAWGNRIAQAPYGAGRSCTSVATPITPGTNRLGGSYSYDAAGNLLNDGFNTLTYDAEGRLATSTPTGGATTTYLYGADGQRAGKTVGGSDTHFIRDQDGTIETTFLPSGWGPEELWVLGKHFGTFTEASDHSGVTGTFSLTNWLGSDVAKADVYTGQLSSAYVSQPFGDGRATLFGGDMDDVVFTGKERDSESGNDYFGARYYGSSMGRWVSPDPSALYYSDPGDPQTLNLYAYVGNHPLEYVDPDGFSWFTTAPCTNTPYAAVSLLGRIENFVDHLFANCGGNSDSGSSDSDPFEPGLGGGGSVYQKLSQQQINNLVDTTRSSFSHACINAFTSVGKATGIPFNLGAFASNLKSGPFDQQPDVYNDPIDATTDNGTPGPQSRATIHLWHSFYGFDPGTQGFTLFHEETHRYFNVTDYSYGRSKMNFDDLFAPFGYRRHAERNGNNGASHQFTEWLKKGC